MLNRLLVGLECRLTSPKWAKIANCSWDTALRDIDTLVDRHIPVRDAPGGWSTSDSLVPAD
jgi:Fic family protein